VEVASGEIVVVEDFRSPLSPLTHIKGLVASPFPAVLSLSLSLSLVYICPRDSPTPARAPVIFIKPFRIKK